MRPQSQLQKGACYRTVEAWPIYAARNIASQQMRNIATGLAHVNVIFCKMLGMVMRYMALFMADV